MGLRLFTVTCSCWLEANSSPPTSHPEEHLLFVHEVQESPFNGQEAEYSYQCIPGVAYQLNEPLKKSFGGIIPVDETTGHIDHDGVHADHREKESPFVISQDIDDIVESSQQ